MSKKIQAPAANVAPAAPAPFVLPADQVEFLRADGLAEGLADAGLGKFAKIFQGFMVTATQAGNYAGYVEACRQWRAGYDGRGTSADAVLARIDAARAKMASPTDKTTIEAASLSRASQMALERRMNVCRSADVGLLIGEKPKAASTASAGMRDLRAKRAEEAKAEEARLAALIQGKDAKTLAAESAAVSKAKIAAEVALQKTTSALTKASESAAKATTEVAKAKAVEVAKAAATELAKLAAEAAAAEARAADLAKARKLAAEAEEKRTQDERASEAKALKEECLTLVRGASLNQLRAIRAMFPASIPADK